MTGPLSGSKIDAIGERLRLGEFSDEVLNILTEYRAMHRPYYETVMHIPAGFTDNEVDE